MSFLAGNSVAAVDIDAIGSACAGSPFIARVPRQLLPFYVDLFKIAIVNFSAQMDNFGGSVTIQTCVSPASLILAS